MKYNNCGKCAQNNQSRDEILKAALPPPSVPTPEVQSIDTADSLPDLLPNQTHDSYKCPHCSHRTTFTNILDHICQQHGRLQWLIFHRTKIHDFQEFQCKKCKFYFDSLPSRASHDCQKNLEYISEFLEPASSSTEGATPASPVTLSSPPKTFKSPKINQKNPQQVLIKCPVCDVRKTRNNINMHVKAAHGITEWIKCRQKVYEELGEVKCQKCSFAIQKSSHPPRTCQLNQQAVKKFEVSSRKKFK